MINGSAEYATLERRKIAVIGAGAIGCVFADAAAAAGHDVQLCVRSPVPAVNIEHNGITRTPPLQITDDPRKASPADWVFIATKTQDTTGTQAWLARLAGEKTVIVLLQNGIDGLNLARRIAGNAEILPSIIYIAAERRAPGQIVHFFGNRLEVPQGETGARLAELLAGKIEIAQQADFTTAAWRKLICNVALNPITALTMQRFGVLSLPRIRDLAEGLIKEAAEVGNAEGAHLSASAIEEIIESCCRLSPQGGTSMLYDRMSGNRLEFEHLTGTIVRQAAQHNIAVPLNTAILALLTAIDHARAVAAE